MNKFLVGFNSLNVFNEVVGHCDRLEELDV